MAVKCFHSLGSSECGKLFLVFPMRNTVIDNVKRPFLVRVLLNGKCRLLNDAVAYSLRRPIDQNTIPNLHTALITRFFPLFISLVLYIYHIS